MRRTMLLLTAGGILLLLAGAGCSSYTGTDNSVSPDDQSADQETTSTDVIDTDQTPASTTDLTVSASLDGANTVKVSWITPKDFDPASNVRIVYGGQTNPEYGKSYWFARSSNTYHDAIIPGIKAGQTHFRVCEFKNNTCVRYSNDVMVDVKG